MKAVILFAILLLAGLIVPRQMAMASDEASGAPFTTIQSIADLVPDDAEMQTANRWNAVGVDRASKSVVANAQGHQATFHLQIELFDRYGSTYRIKAPDGTVYIHGKKVPYRIWVGFRTDQTDALARIHKGATVMLSGTLGRADIRLYDGRPWLSLELREAELQE